MKGFKCNKMELLYGIFILAGFVLRGILSNEMRNYGSDQKNLLVKLEKSYGPRSLRPIRNSSEVTKVVFRLLIAQLIDFDERGQQLTINGWMKQAWSDEFLQWEPDDHNDVQNLAISASKIWIPDINLYENVDREFESIKDINTMVTSVGDVVWYAPVILRSSCKVKVKNFPFDTQNCIMTFGSWAYDTSQLDLIYLDDDDANQEVFSQNGVWELIAVNVTSDLVYFKCCPHPYALVIYSLTLRRQSSFYVVNIIIPCVLLSVLTLLVFYLPPDSGEKISLGMTNLLALILFQQLIAESMPPRGDEAPVLGMYFFAMVLMGCFSIIGTVIVLRVYHRGSDHPVPNWMKRCIQSRKRSKYSTLDRKNPNRTAYTPGLHVEAHVLELARQSVSNQNSSVSRSSPDGYSTPDVDEGRDTDKYKRKSDQEAVTKLVLRELRKSASKSQDQDKREVIACEWREVALFWIGSSLFLCLL
ncbi:neuronal acetylcholine receptor subunit alpha-10-like [Amphiura filiformis]|uniref:neuronal acetylcholine receptor subunit alpha-10-like n=1 Tax=Amphiura filiformis TaxID=82378 RepID=UPI003B22406F